MVIKKSLLKIYFTTTSRYVVKKLQEIKSSFIYPPLSHESNEDQEIEKIFATLGVQKGTIKVLILFNTL